jgi:hypothetical protein
MVMKGIVWSRFTSNAKGKWIYKKNEAVFLSCFIGNTIYDNDRAQTKDDGLCR